MTNANDPTLKSWIDVSRDSDFPIQNLPFGIFKTRHIPPAAGVAIGDQVLDLGVLHDKGYFSSSGLPAGIFRKGTLNDFFALGKKKIREVRERVSILLRHDNAELRSDEATRKAALIPASEVEMLMPVRIPNYTDFYSSE